jgi:hypothetical protein
MLAHLIVVAAIATAAFAAPSSRLGISIDPNGQVKLNLGYVTHVPSAYDKEQDIYTFYNIRFAQPPVFDLRWREPQPPLKDDVIRDGSLGHQCTQSPTAFDFQGISTEGEEDCLFLDLNVPGKAIREPSKYKLPVMSWIFGGADGMAIPRAIPE